MVNGNIKISAVHKAIVQSIINFSDSKIVSKEKVRRVISWYHRMPKQKVCTIIQELHDLELIEIQRGGAWIRVA